MLDLMRRHAYSWGTRVLLAFITLVFVFWGLGSGLFKQAHPLATVDGQRVLPEQVESEANRLRQTIQNMYGANAPAVLKSVNLREEALDQIIEGQLIARQAQHLGLEVSNQSLELKIASERAFQVDGRFDFQTYQEVLRENGLTPTGYENGMRTAMIAETLQHMIEQGVSVSDDEVRHSYDLTHQRVGLAYIEIPWEQFSSKVNPTEQQIANYYQQHAEEFRERERARVAFIHYEPLALAAQAAPGQQEVEAYYKTNLKNRFTHPDLVHARHILISVPAGATPAEKAAAKAKAEDILKQLKAGGDFKALAEKYSDDSSNKHSGGDLGFFSRGQMIKPFEDAAFKMKPGDVDIVETNFGYHIVKVEETKPAHVDSLEEARPKIVEEMRTQLGARLSRQAIGEDLNAALAGAKLQDLAKKRGLDVVEPPSFAKGEPVQGVNPESGLAQKAFAMEAGQVGTAPGPAPYLVQLIEKTPSRIPPLKEIEAAVRAAYVRSMAEADARTDARKLMEQMKTAADFNRVAETNNLTVHNIDPFDRSTASIAGIGNFQEVTDEAGVIAQVPGVIGRVMEHGGNSYVFEVTSRSKPTDEQWASAKTSYSQEYLAGRRAQAWTRFLEDLRSKAKITISADQLGTPTDSSM